MKYLNSTAIGRALQILGLVVLPAGVVSAQGAGNAPTRSPAGAPAAAIPVAPARATMAAAAPSPASGSAPRLERAWARATPPGVNVGAVYLTIRNPGPRADQVVMLRSPASERAEIHETRMSGGIMQMRQITEATVPPGGFLALEPGGTHVMLIGLRSPLVPGASVPLVLTFRHAGEVMANAVVEALGSDPSGH